MTDATQYTTPNGGAFINYQNATVGSDTCTSGAIFINYGIVDTTEGFVCDFTNHGMLHSIALARECVCARMHVSTLCSGCGEYLIV
jgi:hypothetical protein